jgi:pyrroline-5-carboxylate reductase
VGADQRHGWISLQELEPLVAPARDLARAIPLFERLGGAAAVIDVGAFDAMSAATATIVAHLRYLATATISRWLGEQGVAADLASRYVSSIFAGVAERLGPADELAALARFAVRSINAGSAGLPYQPPSGAY